MSWRSVFFFQAEDGIRDYKVTGVQTCALPIFVPTDAPGYRPGKPEDKMGLRASNTVAITFEELRLPAQRLLGDEGMGFGYAMGRSTWAGWASRPRRLGSPGARARTPSPTAGRAPR